MIRHLLIIALLGSVAGCASMPPTCSGNDRRPLNPGKWGYQKIIHKNDPINIGPRLAGKE